MHQKEFITERLALSLRDYGYAIMLDNATIGNAVCYRPGRGEKDIWIITYRTNQHDVVTERLHIDALRDYLHVNAGYIA